MTSLIDVQNGTLSAAVAGAATLTFSGDAYAAVTGPDSCTGGTVLGTSTADTGTLAAALGALPDGPISFYGPWHAPGPGESVAHLHADHRHTRRRPYGNPGSQRLDLLRHERQRRGQFGRQRHAGGSGTVDLSSAITTSFNGDLDLLSGNAAASGMSNLGNGAPIFNGGTLVWTSAFNIATSEEVDVQSGGAGFKPNGFTTTIYANVGKTYGTDTTDAAGGMTIDDTSDGGDRRRPVRRRQSLPGHRSDRPRHGRLRDGRLAACHGHRADRYGRGL